MKAIYVSSDLKLQVIDCPKPVIQKGTDVLIKVTSAGICSSDLEIAAGRHPFATYPLIIGHEFGGIVEAVGKEVRHVNAGDKVTVDPVTWCNNCHSCKIGKHNVCLNLRTMGVHRDGGFCEYAVVPSENVYVFGNQSVDASLLGLAEPFSIGVQINHRAYIRAQDHVLIMGSGPIGLCAMQEAKHRGARVMMTDLLDSRLHRATDMGADYVVNAGCEAAEELFCQCFGEVAPDVVVDTVCTPSSLKQAIDYVGFGGRVVVIGVDTRASQICQADIMKKEISILGSRLNLGQFSHVVEGIDQGFFQPDKLRSHTMPFTEIEMGLQLIKEHPEKVCKINLSF